MNPQTASIFALVFVAIGAVAVFIMLEMTGRTGDRTDKKIWLYTHKILGYIFLALLLVTVLFMIRKAAGFQGELSPRAIMHIVLALALLPLVVIKILLVRRHPQHSKKLPLLGIAIFVLAVALTGISAGYYILHRSNSSYTIIEAIDNDVLDLELGKAITVKKCSKCHSLERVYRAFKSNNSWVVTINKMALLDSPNIASFDVKQTLNYLIAQQKVREEKLAVSSQAEIGKSLVSQKCSICHNLDRIFGARKNSDEWGATVSRMMATMGDPAFLSEEEKADIVMFLSRGKKKINK